MPVILRRSDQATTAGYDSWVVLSGDPASLPRERRRPGVGLKLEAAFDQCAEQWFAIGKALSGDPSSALAHTPACVTNASDFGTMLAWTKLINEWAGEDAKTLVICDDPWLYRHLKNWPGVDAGRPPRLWPAALRLFVRGYAARAKTVITVLRRIWTYGHRPTPGAKGGHWLLAYGHPYSDAEGKDAYFGDLLQIYPGLRRILHVDCNDPLLAKLTRHPGTVSLNGWGNWRYAFSLPFARWRPARRHLQGPYGWLVARAAAREGGTGTAAMIRWQNHCQQRWLTDMAPVLVAWPWENHSWERSFVRRAHALGIGTVGYQHSMVGRHMLNYAPLSNVDYLASIPDRVLCIGAPYYAQLAKWSMPEERLQIAGAFRFSGPAKCSFDTSAPVFAALPFAGAVGAEMMSAIRAAAKDGIRFLVKPHPMLPMTFEDTPGFERTDAPLPEQGAVSGVLYAASAVGLEAYFAGIPTLRFVAEQVVAIDILPENVSVPFAGRDDISGAFSDLPRPSPVPREQVFADVNYGVWAAIFAE